jgi:hypothetical protein
MLNVTILSSSENALFAVPTDMLTHLPYSVVLLFRKDCDGSTYFNMPIVRLEIDTNGLSEFLSSYVGLPVRPVATLDSPKSVDNNDNDNEMDWIGILLEQEFGGCEDIEFDTDMFFIDADQPS